MQSIEHLQHFKARQRAIVQAVLAEQKYQRIVGAPDPESLQLISTSFSRVSWETALERAAQDAKIDEETVEPSREKEHPSIISTDDLRPEVPYGLTLLAEVGASRRNRPRIVSMQA